MLMAGAAFVAPNAGKPPLAKVSSAPAAITQSVAAPVGIVTTLESYRLPPESYEDLIREAAERYGQFLQRPASLDFAPPV